MNPTTLSRVERQSVQELPDAKQNGGVTTTSDFWHDVYARSELLPEPYTYACERVLRWYDRHAAAVIWHGSKSGQIKKVGATGYTMSGGRNLIAYYDNVFRFCQFRAGFRTMIELIFNDYMVFNRGGFMEIIAPGNPMREPTGRITSLAHLDAFHCMPTGDPEFPVVYTDRLGKQHLMHHTRVVQFIDTPDGDQNHPGTGRSALWRSVHVLWEEILMGRYVVTSLDDKPPPGMLVIGGMTREKWTAVMNLYRQEQTTDERPDWGRIVTLFGVDADHAPKVESVAFSNPPDKFDYKIYTELNIHKLALAMGVDIQELWELTGNSLGSAQQSEVQHSKSQGKLYGEFLATFERAMNNYVLPASLEFEFEVRDPMEAQQEANNAKVWVEIGLSLESLMGRENTAQFIANNVSKAADVLLDDNGRLKLPDTDLLAPHQLGQLATVGDNTPLGVQPATAADVPDTTAAVQLALVKDYDATTAAFANAFTDLVGATQDGDLTRRRAGTVLRANVSRLGREAYLEGLKAGGVEEMTEADRNAVAVLTAQQSAYVSAFLDNLGDAPLTPEQAQAHATLWINKSLTPFYQAGLASADADGMYVWKLGDAEHCADCLKMAGQKHRLSEYAAKGILPKADVLSCKGFNCACSIQRTTGRAAGNWL